MNHNVSEEIMKAAGEEGVETVFSIANQTIAKVYPHYYAKNVVTFFLKHHCREAIEEDINDGYVYILQENDYFVGTVTIKQNVINRLFVLPEYQGRGYGQRLMDFAENKIAEKSKTVHIDSSLPAKEMYLKRGYHETKTCHIDVEYGDVLVYDEMEKES